MLGLSGQYIALCKLGTIGVLELLYEVSRKYPGRVPLSCCRLEEKDFGWVSRAPLGAFLVEMGCGGPGHAKE